MALTCQNIRNGSLYFVEKNKWHVISLVHYFFGRRESRVPGYVGLKTTEGAD